MGRKKNPNKSNIIMLSSLIVIAFLVTNIVMIYLNYQNYENKFEILATIIENTSEDNIDAVLGILQERDVVSAEHGYQILEKYGYTDSNNNALFRMFQSQTLLIVASTGVIFTVLMLALLKWKNAVWKETVDVLSQIELTLMHFRENKMSVLELADDIPEYEKITHQLKALGRQLDLLREETVKEKEGTKQLVADISHQLKTPVAALNTSFSILLQNDLNKEEREEFSKRCQSALDGLEVLLQSLLQISRLEAGLIQIELSSKPFIDTILVAVNRVYPKASVKNIEISFEYEPALDKIVIKQDHKWLAEALVNVLDNAIKYSPNDTEIAIRVKKRTTILRVEIEDHGVGIPKEEYHKIFQRFFRGTTQQVKEETGSGIGLYLARKIIEDHNGTISVSSNWKKRVGTENENPGSTFLIQLPVLDMLE